MEEKICMCCGNQDAFKPTEFGHECGGCGSADVILERNFPIVRGGEYPTFAEFQEFRAQGVL